MESVLTSLSERHRDGRLAAGLTVALLYTLSRYVESRKQEVSAINMVLLPDPPMRPNEWPYAKNFA